MHPMLYFSSKVLVVVQGAGTAALIQLLFSVDAKDLLCVTGTVYPVKPESPSGSAGKAC